MRRKRKRRNAAAPFIFPFHEDTKAFIALVFFYLRRCID